VLQALGAAGVLNRSEEIRRNSFSKASIAGVLNRSRGDQEPLEFSTGMRRSGESFETPAWLEF